MQIQRPRPLVDQVSTMLRQRIRNRVYPPGSRLPSESDLAQELGISRATLRTVLAKLAAEGVILRKQGDGTYVNERIRDIDTRYGGEWDFSRLIESNGYRSAIETRALDRRPASEREAAALAIAPGDAVLALVRIFLADGQPVIAATNVIPAALIGREVDPADGQLPIHQFLRAYCGEEIMYAVTDIEAQAGAPELDRIFGRPIDYPLLRLTEIFYNRLNQPLVYGRSDYDHTRLRLRLVQPWG